MLPAIMQKYLTTFYNFNYITFNSETLIITFTHIHCFQKYNFIGLTKTILIALNLIHIPQFRICLQYLLNLLMELLNEINDEIHENP